MGWKNKYINCKNRNLTGRAKGCSWEMDDRWRVCNGTKPESEELWGPTNQIYVF